MRRNRRRHKPASANPGARGARSVTVGLGPGGALRQGAGGALAADASASAARDRSRSPASSTGGEFGPRPQVSISLDDEDLALASVPRAAVGGAAAVSVSVGSVIRRPPPQTWPPKQPGTSLLARHLPSRLPPPPSQWTHGPNAKVRRLRPRIYRLGRPRPQWT